MCVLVSSLIPYQSATRYSAASCTRSSRSSAVRSTAVRSAVSVTAALLAVLRRLWSSSGVAVNRAASSLGSAELRDGRHQDRWRVAATIGNRGDALVGEAHTDGYQERAHEDGREEEDRPAK